MTANIVYSSQERYKDTGIIATVSPGGEMGHEFSLVVRSGCVDLEGSAYLSPAAAKLFAAAIIVAAEIAQGEYNEAHQEV